MRKQLVILVMVVACSGCDSNKANDPANPAKVGMQVKTTLKPDLCQPVDYGNGVLYFGCSDVSFGNGLSFYIQTHKVKVTAMAPNVHGFDGSYTYGYFVTVE